MCEWAAALDLVEGEEVDGMGTGAALVKNSIGGTLEERRRLDPSC